MRHPTPLKRLLSGAIPALALICAGPGTTAAPADPGIRLPDLGGSARGLLSPVEERRLGRAFMKSVRESEPLIDDPFISDYIRTLGNRIAAGVDNQRRFTFFVIDQPMINAFAGPDGHIGVYSGLILGAQSESELAAVIAHEIAHVTQNHLLRAFDSASQLSGPTAAMVLAAIVLGTTVSSQAGQAILAGAQAYNVQSQINFTRGNEEEADRVGIQLLAGAGFDPRAMPAFFERLSQSSRYIDGGAPEFLRTHPMSTTRIADTLARAELYPYRQVAEELGFHLVRARLRIATFNDPDNAVDYFRDTLAQGRYNNALAQRYGLAHALLAAHRTDDARELARELLVDGPDEIGFQLLAADAEEASGNTARALEILARATAQRPASYPVLIARARLLLKHGEAPAAQRLLHDARLLYPEDPELLRLTADVAAAAGDSLDSVLTRSQYHEQIGDLEAAIQLIENAKKAPANQEFYRAERIEARLKELRRLVALEKGEADRQESRRLF